MELIVDTYQWCVTCLSMQGQVKKCQPDLIKTSYSKRHKL